MTEMQMLARKAQRQSVVLRPEKFHWWRVVALVGVLVINMASSIISHNKGFEEGIEQGRILVEADVIKIVTEDKRLLADACYRWWFNGKPEKKNLSGSRKIHKRNLDKIGTTALASN